MTYADDFCGDTIITGTTASVALPGSASWCYCQSWQQQKSCKSKTAYVLYMYELCR